MVDQITVYAVLIRFAPPPAFARSGLSATATFEIARRTGVLLLPVEAVQLREGQAFVEVPSRNPAVKTPERIPVGTGISDGRSIEIVAGLNEGDQVLLPTLQTKAGHGSPFVPRMSSRPPAPSSP